MQMSNRLDNISGYVHPENNSSRPKGGIYKTFTEGQKPKKNEKFGSTQLGTKYSNISESNDDKCPICSKPAINTCKCGYSDKICDNNHIWYIDRAGNIKLGNPHKSS
jgi:hypothetical protein